MLFLLDNYDSFTYNLVQFLRELGQQICVVHNDKITLEEIAAKKPSHIVISPGPGRPEAAGITIPLIRFFAGKIPILGVCLGHQALAVAFGGKVVGAQRIVHGKTSLIYHQQNGLFVGLNNPFRAMRYHSLVVDPGSLPEEFLVSAWTQELGQTTIMAMAHHQLPLFGVQFHPESIASEFGHRLLKNFLEC